MWLPLITIALAKGHFVNIEQRKKVIVDKLIEMGETLNSWAIVIKENHIIIIVIDVEPPLLLVVYIDINSDSNWIYSEWPFIICQGL